MYLLLIEMRHLAILNAFFAIGVEASIKKLLNLI